MLRSFIMLSTLLATLVACSPAPPRPSPSPPTFIDPPAGPGALAPNLAASAGGALLTWLEPTADGGGHTLYLAELRDQQWTPARQVAAGKTFFANWADLPAAVETEDGIRFAHWLQKLGTDTYAYGAELARSRDDGETWEPLGLIHDDASPSEHGFVSYAVLPGGGVQAFWLDGRNMLQDGPMGLRTARIGDAAPGASTLLDERVCECCSTDAAITAAGPIVVYRDRGPTEVRDIAIVRGKNVQGKIESWSEPTLIHDDGWLINGCPVNGPAVAAEGNRVAVAWFSVPASRATVAVAFSDDAGATFTEPVVVDDASPLGRVDVALDAEGHALVTWMGSSNEDAEIRWRRVGSSGESGPVQVVATTTAKRSAGVPRMLRLGDELVFAWVEDSEPSRLRVGLAPLDW